MSNPADLQSLQLSVPRHGHSPDEYEDAVAVHLASGRCAIADGASESSYARPWAELLVHEFVHSDEALSSFGWLERARAHWQAQVGKVALPWYAETKRQEGAFAAFLGLVLDQSHWQCLAVGDSCLFHVRQDALLTAAPLTGSREFNNHPWLLGSQPEGSTLLTRKVHFAAGELAVGDRLWLLTDALAQWFLQEVEQGRAPWQLLDGFHSDLGQCAFAEWIEEQRAAHALRNDDVTLLALWS